MAYNTMNGEILMFGGTLAGPELTNETWFFVRGTGPGTGWFKCDTQPFHPCGSPPLRRNGVGLAFGDTSAARMVMFGGGVGEGTFEKFQDTWTWDGSFGWSCHSQPSVCRPPG